MHSKGRPKKLKMVGCQRIDVELYKNFYAILGVRIQITLAINNQNLPQLMTKSNHN